MVISTLIAVKVADKKVITFMAMENLQEAYNPLVKDIIIKLHIQIITSLEVANIAIRKRVNVAPVKLNSKVVRDCCLSKILDQ